MTLFSFLQLLLFYYEVYYFLTIALFIYLYFIILNYDDIKHLKKETTRKEVITSHVALIAALLFFIGGILTWIAEINRNTPDNDFGII